MWNITRVCACANTHVHGDAEFCNVQSLSLTVVGYSNYLQVKRLPGWLSKEFTCNAGDLGLIPGLGRPPGGGHGNPLQYSCLENPHG